jgi:hypothetical protein
MSWKASVCTIPTVPPPSSCMAGFVSPTFDGVRGKHRCSASAGTAQYSGNWELTRKPGLVDLNAPLVNYIDVKHDTYFTKDVFHCT